MNVANLISWFDVDEPTTERLMLNFIRHHETRWGKKPKKILLSCKHFELFSRNLDQTRMFFGQATGGALMAKVEFYGVPVSPSSVIARGVATDIMPVPFLSNLTIIGEEESEAEND